MKRNRLRVSIVIPAFNEESHLHATLEAVARQTVKPFEVIVVDNNSTDGTAAIARSFPFVILVNEPKQGVVHARNRGFDEAKGEIIGRIDADTVLDPGWVEKVRMIFEDRDIDAVSGFVRYFDIALEGVIDKVHAMLRAQIARNMRPVFLWGSNMAVRRQAWREVRRDACCQGKFHEDMDLAAHLGGVGKGVVYDSSLCACASGRRIDMNFFCLARYIWLNDTTYRRHRIGLKARRHMYPTMLITLFFYPLLRVLYRGFDAESRRFRMSLVLRNRASTNRVDPAISHTL